MYSFHDLKKEIAKKIEWLQHNNGTEMHPTWITEAIMKDHPDVNGVDADFHLCASRHSVRQEVTKQINKVESDMPENQLKLEGFEYLQEWYVILRGEDRVAVRIENMSIAEGRQKAMEYRKMGDSCYAHANEIDRYFERRAVENPS